MAFQKGHTINIGRHPSESTKLKMSLAQAGKTLSEEHLENMRLAKFKNGGPMLGKHHSEITKQRIGEASKRENLSEETLEKLRASGRRRRHTEEEKRKIGLSRTGEKHPMYGRRFSVEQKIRMGLGSIGAKNVNWKGGITPLNKVIRHSIEYKIWRLAVYRRDYFTCQQCGIKGKKIHAHHVKLFSDYPELRFEISNGLTLCKNCHENSELHKRELIV